MSALLVSVGEASGDRQAAAVVRSLEGQPEVLGKIGPELLDAGAHEVVGLEGHFGLAQPVAMWRELRRSQRALLDAAERRGVQRALLVDYSGFHLPLGRALRRRGVHVVGFIPPKLWAWGGWRFAKARAAYDELYTILPFEADWWSERGVAAAYCGNPIAEQTPALESDAGGPVALVPGSRPGELAHVGPLLAATAQRLLVADPTLRFRVPVAPTLERTAVEATFAGLPVDYTESMSAAAGGASAAVVCNGTAALEVALVGTPHVITYKTSPLHWRIGNWLVNLEQTAPSNLTLVRTGDVEPVWEEIFQSDATPDALSSRVTQLRSDPSLRQQQLGGSATLRRLLGAGVGVSAVAKAWQG